MDLSYEDWYADVDRICVERAGLGIDDLPDGPSWDAWNDGTPADEYVADRLAEDGFPELAAKPAGWFDRPRYIPAARTGAAFVNGNPITDRNADGARRLLY